MFLVVFKKRRRKAKLGNRNTKRYGIVLWKIKVLRETKLLKMV